MLLFFPYKWQEIIGTTQRERGLVSVRNPHWLSFFVQCLIPRKNSSETSKKDCRKKAAQPQTSAWATDFQEEFARVWGEQSPRDTLELYAYVYGGGGRNYSSVCHPFQGSFRLDFLCKFTSIYYSLCAAVCLHSPAFLVYKSVHTRLH